MTTIRKADYVFSVDIEKTKGYYSTHQLCECVDCRNYYAQIREQCPDLTAFLSEFGVDASKPDEAWSVESEGSVNYISVDYTVCGKVDVMGGNGIDIDGNRHLHVHITDGFASPNEQTGDYFTVSAENITLGWVIEEDKRHPVRDIWQALAGNKKSKKK